MSLITRLVASRLGLPPAARRPVGVERDLVAPMPDGVRLLADRYFPRDDGRAPLILMRSPYDRRGVWDYFAPVLAERGYQVLIQSTRGTVGSGGDFDPRYEADDGPATIEWIRRQPWFGGRMATWGASYLGYVQWALAGADVPEWKAAVIQDGPSEMYHAFFYHGGTFGLGNALRWLVSVYPLDRRRSPLRRIAGQVGALRGLRRGIAHLPLCDADRMSLGCTVGFFQRWLAHEELDEYWAAMDQRGRMSLLAAPVDLVAGWYDFFLPNTLANYAALREAGRRVRLLIGPWTHGAGGFSREAFGESFAWLEAHLKDEPIGLREAPVRLFVTGADRWVELDDWPPPVRAPSRWYLQPDGGLAANLPPDSPPDRYRYDPAHPTPNVGGPILAARAGGPRDNRRLEGRADVLTYTGRELDRDLEIVGPVSVELWVRSSLGHTDFFTRLCDVHPNGRSVNVCDGIIRLRPGRPAADADGLRRLLLELWPAAHQFRRGHRIRLQVSGGVHPRFARNLGTGEPLATSTTMRAADQEVFHDPKHPSAVLLPIR
ncbi:MAG: CocE/NonD family hydrolase [Streptosporangiales bacterium]|nr:CocE/NonD family hydrolase [Streptosporangiales bacterium]